MQVFDNAKFETWLYGIIVLSLSWLEKHFSSPLYLVIWACSENMRSAISEMTWLCHIPAEFQVHLAFYVIQLPVLLFLDVLHQQRTSFTIIRKKIFDMSFPFLMDSPQGLPFLCGEICFLILNDSTYLNHQSRYFSKFCSAN